MIYKVSTVLLFCGLTLASPFPSPAGAVASSVPALATPFPAYASPSASVATPIPTVPTPFPFGPTGLPIRPPGPNGRPFGQGYNNNPYNNYPGGPAIPIVSYSSEHSPDGTYSFSFSTADGKQAQESGYLKDAYIDNAGEPQGTQVVQGSYSYVSPEGTPIEVTYVADENGFRPAGVHIPGNGKPIVPLLDKNNNQIIDPAYNRYNPFNRDRYNNFGQYNNQIYNNQYNRPYDPRYNTRPYDPRYNNRPYDPRYPHDPSKYNPYYNNNYYPYPASGQPKNIQDEAKKSAA